MISRRFWLNRIFSLMKFWARIIPAYGIPFLCGWSMQQYFQTFTPLKHLGQLKSNFYVVVWTAFWVFDYLYSSVPSHIMKMAIPFIFSWTDLFQNQQVNYLGVWYMIIGLPWPCLWHAKFYFSCHYMGKCFEKDASLETVGA